MCTERVGVEKEAQQLSADSLPSAPPAPRPIYIALLLPRPPSAFIPFPPPLHLANFRLAVVAGPLRGPPNPSHFKRPNLPASCSWLDSLLTARWDSATVPLPSSLSP